MNKPLPQRKPLRLSGYDYSQNGAYFVTLCTQHKQCLFGDVVNGEMVLNEVGLVVETVWLKTQSLRDDIILDEFVIMPNHMHMIVCLVESDCIAPQTVSPNGTIYENGTMQSFPTKSNLGYIIRGFKSATTSRINQSVGVPVWQRGYHDHIIRNEANLNRIRHYISNNPTQWHLDENNPVNKHSSKRGLRA